MAADVAMCDVLTDAYVSFLDADSKSYRDQNEKTNFAERQKKKTRRQQI